MNTIPSPAETTEDKLPLYDLYITHLYHSPDVLGITAPQVRQELAKREIPYYDAAGFRITRAGFSESVDYAEVAE